MENKYLLHIALTFFIILVCHYVATKMISNTRKRERLLMVNGRDVVITILAMRQKGIFINNNPVMEMQLRVEELLGNESWVIEKHYETAYLTAVDCWKAGNRYQGKAGENKKDILFVVDSAGKPVLSSREK